jgi:multiple antibiotic resistance protein
VQIWKTFVIAFSTLLPMIGPVGSALEIFTLVGVAPSKTYFNLARKITINNIIFLTVVELVGSAVLTFFGISIPIMEIAGGAVITAIGWTILNQSDGATGDNPGKVSGMDPKQGYMAAFSDKMFYPFTFPIVSGPGAVVAMLTLSARASGHDWSANLLGHLGIFLAVVAVSVMFFFCFAYSPRLAQRVAPSSVHMFMRLISFITLAIGIQFVWNGVNALLITVGHSLGLEGPM